MNKTYLKYCHEVFDTELKKEGINNVILKVVYNPLLKESGILSPNIDEKRYKITINLYKFKDMSSEDKLFYIYNTICHEIEHIKVFENTKRKDFYSYNHIITLMEYITYLSELNISPDKLNLGVKSKLIIGKKLSKNYKVSLNEINGLLVGYQKSNSIEAFSNKRETTNKIIEALEILNDVLEVGYCRKDIAIDNFGTYYIGTAQYVKKYPELLNEYKVLSNFFYQDGNKKDIYTIYKERNHLNCNLYDKFLTNLLLCQKSNKLVILCMENDDEFKKYIYYLILKYVEKMIRFIDNMDKCKIIIPDEEILNDNLNMMMNSVDIINKLNVENKVRIKTPMVF